MKRRFVVASSIYEIPIILIARDRLTCLKNLVSYLKWIGYHNIHIIDNGSTYGPLLEWYEKTDVCIYRVDNLGQSAPWQVPQTIELINNQEFVVSDPDLYPTNYCPTTTIERAYYLLQKYPQFDKVGPSLEINDLPDHYIHKERVIRWESQFWRNKGPEDTWNAPIDTTFALYRKGTPYKITEALRLDSPYTWKHMPWYLDFDNLPEDELYYMEHVNTEISNWNSREAPSDHVV